MNLDRVDAGRDLPNEFNVIIEIPMNADPVKYEVDKVTGALFVDRFMMTLNSFGRSRPASTRSRFMAVPFRVTVRIIRRLARLNAWNCI